MYMKEKKTLNKQEEDWKSQEEEYNHILEDWFIALGKYEEI